MTDEPSVFSQWAPPGANDFGGSEDNAETYASGEWNDMPNSGWSRRGIIEWSADCNGDSIVDYGQIRAGDLLDANANNIPDCCEQGTSCDQLSVGLQAHYRFDGNCLDASGNGRNGAGAGIVYVAGPDGLAGTAASFDGSTSFVQVDGVPIPTDNAFSWAFWLRMDGLGNSYGYIIERIAGIGINLVSPAIRFRSDGSLGFGSCCSGGGSLVETPPNMVASGVWAHVACTSSTDGARRIYVNGALVGEGFAVDYGQQLPTILIGRDRLDCCDRFRGAIDDLRLYSRPLSASEIATLHSAAATCPGDLNQSGTVDAEDLASVLFAWGTDGGKTPEADIDRSGTVDANDLSVVLGSWGPCPG